MRSLVVLGAAAAIFLFYLVRNEREAQALVRTEDLAIERIRGLAQGPPGPPHVEDGYRFVWAKGGELPPVLLGYPDGHGVCLFAATPEAVFAYELFGDEPPDATIIRVHVARGAEGAPPGWRKVR